MDGELKQTLPKGEDSPTLLQGRSLAGIEIKIKADPASSISNDDMYEGDIYTGLEESLCKDEVDLGNTTEMNSTTEEPGANPLKVRRFNIRGIDPPLDDLMRKHVEAREGRFVCNICGKSNGRPDSMRRHMRDLHLRDTIQQKIIGIQFALDVRIYFEYVTCLQRDIITQF